MILGFDLLILAFIFERDSSTTHISYARVCVRMQAAGDESDCCAITATLLVLARQVLARVRVTVPPATIAALQVLTVKFMSWCISWLASEPGWPVETFCEVPYMARMIAHGLCPKTRETVRPYLTW